MKHFIGYASTAVGSFFSGLLMSSSFRFFVGAGLVAYLLSAPVQLMSAYVQKHIELMEKRMQIEADLENKRLDQQFEIQMDRKESDNKEGL